MTVKIQGVPSLARDPLHESLLSQSRTKRFEAKRTIEISDIAPTPRNDLLPQLDPELVPVAHIRCPKRRFRKLSDADVQEVANAILAYGFIDPITISAKGELIDGEIRLKAAVKLGLARVPCIRLSHLSEQEARSNRIAFNRIGAKRAWDVGELKLELQELQDIGQPIEILGFTSIEIDQILAVEQEPVMEAPSLQDKQPTVTQPGDIWSLGQHRLLCGDATDPAGYSKLLGDGTVQLVIADPPYNVRVSSIVSTPHDEFVEGSGEMTDDEFSAFLKAYLGCCRTVLVDGGIAFSFMDWKHIHQLIDAGLAEGFKYLNLICWVKSAGGMGSFYRSQHELITAFKKPGEHKNNILLGKHGRDRTNCWYEAGAGTLGTEAREMLAEHPTPKPPKLLMDAIYDVTDRGDIVLDPFGGSGSTLIAAHRTKRVARLIEMSPEYCDLIVRRWIEETGETAIHAQSGESFAQRANGLVDLEESDDAS